MLGDLSAKYESNGDPGCVSSGDYDLGSISYGAYQFASAYNVPDDFIAWLVNQWYQHADYLQRAGKSGTPFFSQVWAYVAELDHDGFLSMQHEYVKQQYYDTAIEYLRQANFHIEKHNEVMKNVVWSRSVQYGAGLVVEMFEEAAKSLGHPNLSYVDDEEFDHDMIYAIYHNVCMTPEWTSGSPALREGLYSRFQSECAEALAMLG